MDCSPAPQFARPAPPKSTNTASSPFVVATYFSSGFNRRADMLIHSHCTLSRVKRSNSPDCPSGNDREWMTKGRELIEDYSCVSGGTVPLCEISDSFLLAVAPKRFAIRRGDVIRMPARDAEYTAFACHLTANRLECIP